MGEFYWLYILANWHFLKSQQIDISLCLCQLFNQIKNFDTVKSSLWSFYDLCLRLRTTVLPILRIKKRLKMNINWYKLIKLICFVTWNYSTFICACMNLGFQKHYFGHKIEIINLHWKLLLLKKEKEIADFNQVKTQKSVNAHWEFCNG